MDIKTITHVNNSIFGLVALLCLYYLINTIFNMIN
jgi:hypothetical protein